MLEVLGMNAIILVSGLTSEGHGRKCIDLDLGTVRVPGNLSGGKKDQAGTSRHRRRLLPCR